MKLRARLWLALEKGGRMKAGIQRADTYTKENGNTKEDARTKAAYVSGLAENGIYTTWMMLR